MITIQKTMEQRYSTKEHNHAYQIRFYIFVAPHYKTYEMRNNIFNLHSAEETKDFI
jgi:hypothetical protein